MPRLACCSLLVAITAVSLVGCGGGGSGSGASTTVTELQQERASLQGDWQLGGKQSTAFIVRTSDEWNQVWAQRKAAVACSPTAAPYNQAVCESAGPPSVDFSRYALVGLLINSVFYFDTPTPREVSMNGDSQVLSVSYRFINPGSPTFFYTVTGRFFLVPQTSASLETHSTLCNFSC